MVLLDEANGDSQTARILNPHTMLFWGLKVLMLLWFSALMWALRGDVVGEDWKNSEALFGDMGSGMEVLQLASVHFLDSPSPYFAPHALTCPKSDIAFLADQFRVFQLQLTNDGSQTSTTHVPRPYPCDVNGTIADIAATCDGSVCWPVVLLNEAPPRVFDCWRNRTIRLLQTAAGSTNSWRVATNSSPDASHLSQLFISEGTEVVQYHESLRRGGYAPYWVVANWTEGSLSLDVTGNKLISFHKHGTVLKQDLITGELCGKWKMPNADKILGAGCAHLDSVKVLTSDGGGLQVQQALLPPVDACTREKARAA